MTDLELVKGKGFLVPPDAQNQLPAEFIIKTPAIEKLKGELSKYVVCIRKEELYRMNIVSTLDMLLRDPNASTKETPFEEMLMPSGSLGTGVVIGSEMVDGSEEYLILTNNHVVTPEPFNRNIALGPNELSVIDKILFEADLSIVKDTYDSKKGVKLEVLATAPDQDAALLRTVRAKKQFPVFPFSLGIPESELSEGSPIITAGYPGGLELITASGEITSLDALNISSTTHPNRSYMVQMKMDPGQSGSPIVTPQIVKHNGGTFVNFPLLGLIYAGSPVMETMRLVTPYSGFAKMVESRESLPSQRGRLDAPVSPADVDAVLNGFNGVGGMAAYEVGPSRFFFERLGSNEYVMREYRGMQGVMMKGRHLDWYFRLHGGGAIIDRLEYVKKGKQNVTSLSDRPALHAKSGRLMTGWLNQFKFLDEIREMYESSQTAVEGKWFQYDRRIYAENASALFLESNLILTKLYGQGFLDKRFLFGL